MEMLAIYIQTLKKCGINTAIKVKIVDLFKYCPW